MAATHTEFNITENYTYRPIADTTPGTAPWERAGMILGPNHTMVPVAYQRLDWTARSEPGPCSTHHFRLLGESDARYDGLDILPGIKRLFCFTVGSVDPSREKIFGVVLRFTTGGKTSGRPGADWAKREVLSRFTVDTVEEALVQLRSTTASTQVTGTLISSPSES